MEPRPTYLGSLNGALHALLESDDRVMVIGEDIVDPYGGAFKVTKGLSTRYPDRVLSTPISEAAITGIGTGLALRGVPAVVEIMFGDFLTLAADQLVNHAAKFRLMYGSEVPVPLVVRTPVGAGRGYGPTHSQSLEKIFLGIPGLTVVAPSHFHDPGEELRAAVEHAGPVLFLEHKLLYPRRLVAGTEHLAIEGVGRGPFATAIVRNHPPTHASDLVILSYGGISRFLEEMLKDYVDEEIWCTAILPSCISEPDMELILREVLAAGRVLVVEEGCAGYGWGQDLSHRIQEAAFGRLAAPVRCLAADPTVIPASFAREAAVMVSREKIEAAALELMK